ncbi:MAG: multicopper oxidase domain-containing protein [Actinomycetes bacterium]
MSSQPSSPQSRSFLTVFAALTAVVAFLLATTAIVAVSAKSDSSPSATSAPIAVTVSEYKITPAAISASGHVQLAVTNAGTMTHNFSVPDLGKKTRDLAPGQSQTLDLGSPAAGTYKVLCEVVGHADLGMVASLTVSASGTGSSSASSMPGMDMAGSANANDAATLKAESDKMQASFAAYPAKTEGLGNQPLVPTIAADGTKVFKLTAAITDWEVSPGKIVKAWTYNGTVPGPLIKVNVGDKVQIDLTNNLPGAGTDLHMHGVMTDFAMDGVAPITQAIIPGDGGTFSYNVTPDHAQVGMYHAHNMGEMAVPNGMFGAFEVGDMPLPAGKTVSGIKIPANITIAQEVPMVLNDAGVIGLSLNGKAFPATTPIVTNVGDWIEVQYFNEGLAMHPMHQHEFPGIVIAKDGLPLDSPYAMDTLVVAPGERYTVLYNTNKVGTWVWHCHILNHVEGPSGMLGMVTAIVVK